MQENTRACADDTASVCHTDTHTGPNVCPKQAHTLIKGLDPGADSSIHVLPPLLTAGDLFATYRLAGLS